MKKKAYLIFLFFFASNYLFSFQIDTFSVFSFSMNKEIKNIVIKPDFHKNKKDIPVVYLLHGAYGNYTDWTSKTKGLGEYSDNNNIIIVCADGGYNSWYFDSPIDKNYMYETYIVNELIPFVDSNYNTSKEKNYRAISGLSMGGHGAFYIAFKNPNLFAAAGSMSGGLDIRPFFKNWDIKDRIGSIKKYPNNWEKFTVINLTDKIKEKKIELIFDCGKDDFFFDVNIAFHEKLKADKIIHTFNIKEGGHDWVYWNNSVYDHLNFFTELFKFAR